MKTLWSLSFCGLVTGLVVDPGMITGREPWVSSWRPLAAPPAVGPTRQAPHRYYSQRRMAQADATADVPGEETSYLSSLPSDSSSSRGGEENVTAKRRKAEKLKRELLSLGAAYDRGFGATPSVRSKVEGIIRELGDYNPTADAAVGIDGSLNDDPMLTTPLRGTWQMVWTTALDVLSLGASPVTTVSAIYQDISDPPMAINIIDLIPRAQALFPPGWAPSLTRAKVKTRANRRTNKTNRVGLVFESVEVRPVEILGFRVPDDLPSPLSFDLPRIAGVDMTSDSAPGYFDVVYLDEDMLIIDQNEPGGTFVSIRVQNADLPKEGSS